MLPRTEFVLSIDPNVPITLIALFAQSRFVPVLKKQFHTRDGILNGIAGKSYLSNNN